MSLCVHISWEQHLKMGNCFSRTGVTDGDGDVDPVIVMQSVELADDLLAEYVRSQVSQLASLGIALVMEDLYQARRAEDSGASDEDF